MNAAQRSAMTAPRSVLPGDTYLVTRRCAQRQFLLRPSQETNDILRFLLAVAAQRHGILVHTFCVMSNHVHLLLTDPQARLPEFQRYLGSLVARAVNASLGRWETFWGPDSYSAVRLVSPEDIVDKAAYALANPVAAGLVRTARLWPGLWSEPEHIGEGPAEVLRPKRFFAEEGALPRTASLELTPPPGFASAAEFRDRVITALAAHEDEARQRIKRKFKGVAWVLGQKPTDRPASEAPRRELNPRVAARCRWKRIEALTRLKDFVDDYRRAWAARRAGDLDAVFPAGTYLLRVLHGVPCAGVG